MSRVKKYPLKLDPEWDTVMHYFGLDTSFVWSAEQVIEYTNRYQESIAKGVPGTDTITKPEVIVVTIENGDVALFVNADAIYALDASDSGKDPAEIGKYLAEALGVELQMFAMAVPTKDDWSWNDVHELLLPSIPPNPAAPLENLRGANDEVPSGTAGKLVTLDGETIIGTHEELTGTAGVNTATRTEEGTLDLDFDGETDIDWNGQRTARLNGQMIFVTASGDIVPESEVKLVNRMT